MADIPWPLGLTPYRVLFYLQPHVGGQESPFTRTRKVYGLSAPRWIARLTFRGGYGGLPHLGEAAGFGPLLDSLIVDLHGGLNIAVFHDFRRPRPIVPLRVTGPLLAVAAPAGVSSIRIGGYAPYAVALSLGDYIGGDGRPHITSRVETLAAGGRVNGAGSIMADKSGVAIIGFNPPLSAPIAAGTTLQWPVTGRFQLASEDAGQNETDVGELTEYALDFTEALP